ncbi:MAG TPA: STAS domain-containing protein [Tepidisphaeraceae bacterium]|nr:STAS domain-containing protein [Tepidisphaeraceae bacterium]
MAREYFRFISEKSVNVIELTMPAGTDVSEFDTLNQRTLAGIDAAPDDGWILDLAEFSYVGSAALGFMINVRQRVQQGGGMLVICGVSAQIMSTLRASSLGRLFSISESRPAAIAAVLDWRASRRRKPRAK